MLHRHMHVCVVLESIVRHGAKLPGLVFFEVKATELVDQHDVDNWPRINVFPDEAADGKSAVNGLQSAEYRLNLAAFWDVNHGGSNNHYGVSDNHYGGSNNH